MKLKGKSFPQFDGRDIESVGNFPIKIFKEVKLNEEIHSKKFN